MAKSGGFERRLNMKSITAILYSSPLGVLTLESDGTNLTAILFPGEKSRTKGPVELLDSCQGNNSVFQHTCHQLDLCFAGNLKEFNLPLAPAGTAFQKTIWAKLRKIPYGQTTTYGELAKMIGSPTACRAVGAANGRNPLPIVIPCHRVVGSTDKLTGYAGGMAIKETLLKLEGTI